MNCRIVDAICYHNFAQAPRVLVSFQLKEAHFFEKNEKIVTLVTLTYFFIHTYPCFYLILNNQTLAWLTARYVSLRTQSEFLVLKSA